MYVLQESLAFAIASASSTLINKNISYNRILNQSLYELIFAKVTRISHSIPYS